MTQSNPKPVASSTSALPTSAAQPKRGAAVLKAALGSLGRSPAFVVAGAILLIAAIGLNGATKALSLNFRKQAMALRSPIATLPKDLGPWRQVSRDMPLSDDIQHVLGTDKYIFRDFVDTRRLTKGQIEIFDNKDATQAERTIELIRANDPRAVMRLSVTYYTGMVDTVAHVPDRCFVADGYEPTTQDYRRWKLASMQVDDKGYRFDAGNMRVSEPGTKASSEDEGVPIRFMNFEDQDNRRASVTRSVSYFFQVNGRYESNPLAVRQSLQDLLEKYGYYAKVELMTTIHDIDTSVATNTDFLTYALPELEKCFPDWAGRHAKGGKAGEASATPVATK